MVYLMDDYLTNDDKRPHALPYKTHLDFET
jgi:hypothetical protein